MEQPQTSRMARAWPGKVASAAIAGVKKSYENLKNRYGPGYAQAMLGVAFVGFLSPIPGSLPVGVALIVLIAEAHRAIAKRGGFAEAIADLVVVVKANTPSWAAGRWRRRPY